MSGNDLVTALSKLSSGRGRRAWATDDYDDALDVREFALRMGMTVRVRRGREGGWLVERMRDEFGRYYP